MSISFENRSRFVLLTFVLVDHLIWIYGGHFEQVAFSYVVLSEIVRVISFLFVVASFFNKNILKYGVYLVMIYCTIMVPLNFYGSYSVKGIAHVPNIMLFKKEQEVPIEYSLMASVFYLYYVLFSYYISAKYILIGVLKNR